MATFIKKLRTQAQTSIQMGIHMAKVYIPKMRESIIKGVNPGFKKYKRALQLALIVGGIKLAALAVVAFLMWWTSCKPSCSVVGVPDLHSVVHDQNCEPYISDGGWVKSPSIIKSRAEFYADVIWDNYNFMTVPKAVKALQAKARKPPKPVTSGTKAHPPPAKKKGVEAVKPAVISHLDSFTPLNLWGPFLGAVAAFASEILKNASDPNHPSLNNIPPSGDIIVRLSKRAKFGSTQPVYQVGSSLDIFLEYNKPRQLQNKKKLPSGSRRSLLADLHAPGAPPDAAQNPDAQDGTPAAGSIAQPPSSSGAQDSTPAVDAIAQLPSSSGAQDSTPATDPIAQPPSSSGAQDSTPATDPIAQPPSSSGAQDSTAAVDSIAQPPSSSGAQDSTPAVDSIAQAPPLSGTQDGTPATDPAGSIAQPPSSSGAQDGTPAANPAGSIAQPPSSSNAQDSTPAVGPIPQPPSLPGVHGKDVYALRENLQTILQFVNVLKTVRRDAETAGVKPTRPLPRAYREHPGVIHANLVKQVMAKMQSGKPVAAPAPAPAPEPQPRRSLQQGVSPNPWASGTDMCDIRVFFYPVDPPQWGRNDSRCLLVGFFTFTDGMERPGYFYGNFTEVLGSTNLMGAPPQYSIGATLLKAATTGMPLQMAPVIARGTFTGGKFAPDLPSLTTAVQSDTFGKNFVANFTDGPDMTKQPAPMPDHMIFDYAGSGTLQVMGSNDTQSGVMPMPMPGDPLAEGFDPIQSMFQHPAFAAALKDPATSALLADPSFAAAMGDFSGMGGNMTKLFGAVSEYGIDFSKVDFSDLGIKQALPGLGPGGSIDFEKLAADPEAASTLLTNLVSVLDAKYPAPFAPPDFPPGPGGAEAPYGYGETIKYDSDYFNVQQFDFPYNALGDDSLPIGCDKTLFNMVMGSNWLDLNKKRMSNATLQYNFKKRSRGERMITGLKVRYTLSWRTCAAILRTAAVAANTSIVKEDYRLFSYTTAFFEQLDAIGLDGPEFCQYISQSDPDGTVGKTQANTASDMANAKFWLPGLPYGRNNTGNDTRPFNNQTSFWCIKLGSGMFTDVNRLLNPNSKKKPSIDLRDLKLFDTAFRAFAVLTNDTTPDAVMVTMGLTIRAIADALMRTAQDLKADLSNSLGDISLQCCKVRCIAVFSVIGMALGYLAWIELVVGSICLIIYIALATHIPKFKDPTVKYSDVFSVVVSRVMGQVAGDLLEKTGAGEKLQEIKGEAMGAAEGGFGDDLDKAKGVIENAQARAEDLKSQAVEMQAQAQASKQAWGHPNSVGEEGFKVVSIAKTSGSIKSTASIGKQ